MNWLGRFYLWFWYHTEFWLTPVNRRPYTFIMRDWIYTHPNATTLLVLLFYTGVIILSQWYNILAIIIASIGSFLLAHLVWGSAWIEGQQEYPEYTEED